MSESEPGLISRAEHDASMAAHRLWAHRVAFVLILAIVAALWFAYAVRRDYIQGEAVHAVEKAAAAAALARVAGSIPAPAPAQQVSTDIIGLPRSIVDKLLNRPAAPAFANRPPAKPPRQEPPTKSQPAKAGDITQVTCPPPDVPMVTATVDQKTGATTTFYTCPTPAPVPNVTRLDPTSTKAGDSFEAKYRETPTEALLADFDVLGEINPPRGRLYHTYGLLLPKAGGRVVAREYTEPRSTLAWGHHFEVYGEAFRQQAFGVSTAGVAAGQPGYGAALGAVLDAFRYKDAHFQPLLEGGWVAGVGYVRIGARVPVCIGAECP
jgi:hypothetical protein